VTAAPAVDRRDAVALARHDSPNRGNRHLGLAKALVYEMPHSLAALTGGRPADVPEPIAVNLVISDQALLGVHDDAAEALRRPVLRRIGGDGVAVAVFSARPRGLHRSAAPALSTPYCDARYGSATT